MPEVPQPVTGTSADLKPGYVFFTYYPGDFVSRSIAYFTRGYRLDKDQPVSHTGICAGGRAAIESHARTGVARCNLGKYLDDPKCCFYYRVPKEWNEATGELIVAKADQHVGDGYAIPEIASELLAHSLLGTWLNKVTGGRLERHVADALRSRTSEICSQLVSIVLKQLPWLDGVGPLKNEADEINPQELASASELWQSELIELQCGPSPG